MQRCARPRIYLHVLRLQPFLLRQKRLKFVRLSKEIASALHGDFVNGFHGLRTWTKWILVRVDHHGVGRSIVDLRQLGESRLVIKRQRGSDSGQRGELPQMTAGEPASQKI